MGSERARLMVESLEALNEAVQDALETLAYAEATAVPAEGCPAIHVPRYITTVVVKRPYAGFIRLTLSREMALNLVGSMLGSAEQMGEEWIHDGLSELVNTIGGRILARLVDTHSSFDLGIPKTIFVEQERMQSSAAMVRQIYAVNEGHLELELEFKRELAA